MKRTTADLTTHLTTVLLLGLLVVGLAAIMTTFQAPLAAETSKSDLAFEEVSVDRGFTYSANAHMQMGNSRAGVYVSDVTNNGYPDILAIGGDEPVLYINDGGHFEASTALPEINATISAAVFFDKNGNGWEDLFLLPRDDSPILLANEEGTFEHRSAGLADLELRVPVAASVADYNRNGCLDVFIVQNGEWQRGLPAKEQRAKDAQILGQEPSEIVVENDNGNPNYLLEGDCASGTFEDVTTEVGIDGERWSMATSFADFTGNGYPDIHEANDFNYDYLWVNNEGDGFERERLPDTNRHAMSSLPMDVTGNGELDLFVTNIHLLGDTGAKQVLASVDNSGNNLLINDGGGFSSQEFEYNVRDGGWGWAAVASDFTNNGEVDLIHATHHETNLNAPEQSVLTQPRVWVRDGGTFRRVDSAAAGFLPQNGRGLAALDFNGNGQEDLVTSNLDSHFKLYENQGPSQNWLQVTVRDGDGAIAIGARATIHSHSSGSDIDQHIPIKARTDLLSQSSRRHHVGLGDATKATVEVTFPDGTIRTYGPLDSNQHVELYKNGSVKTV